MSGTQDASWPPFYPGHKWPWQQTLLERRLSLQADLDKRIIPHVDRRDAEISAWHDRFDGEKPYGDMKSQRYIQGLVKIKKVRMASLFRSVADSHMFMDSWDKEKKNRVYEAVERYVYGVDEVLRWEGCEEDEEKDTKASEEQK